VAQGKRESHWLVIRRCLAIIRRAQRGPATWKELAEAVLEQDPEAYGGTQGKTLHRRLENDLRRIRDELLVDLYYDRQAGGYGIRDVWLPLLDLPDDDLATIAWLEEMFSLESPQHDEVHSLLDKLRLYLGSERLGVIERCRTTLTVDLEQRDEDEARASVWRNLTRALREKRRIELVYHSSTQQQPCRHVVDPYEFAFDAARGHYYLRGYCRHVDGVEGREEERCFIAYRLGRILAVTVLPQKLPPVPPVVVRYAVVYELTPAVAQPGVTRQPGIDIHNIERREDGGALVCGETDNVFWAARTLLHYGSNCRVVGGPEMVQEMRAVVEGIAKVYEGD
jgi:predicted DNA-binding transcriptional regulator YafY